MNHVSVSVCVGVADKIRLEGSVEMLAGVRRGGLCDAFVALCDAFSLSELRAHDV